MTPCLKWAGGKRWIANFINDIYTAHELDGVVEPFCGAAAISLKIGPSHAILNDNNRHLINFWSQVKENGLVISISKRNTTENFLKHREDFNKSIHLGKVCNKSQAQRFYFLNRTCHSGLCRFNQKGEFNVGFGKYKSPTILKSLKNYQKAIENFTFTNQPFEKVMLSANQGNLIFLDPPYWGGVFTAYSEIKFTWEDQVAAARSASLSSAKVIATNQDHEDIIELYKAMGFDVYTYKARRTISCNGERSPVKEMIAFKGLDIKTIQSIAKKYANLNLQKA